MSFPSRIDDITVEWLNEVFTKKKVLTTDRIIGFNAELLDKQGTTSRLYLITLLYNRDAAQGPCRIIAKFSSDDVEINNMVRTFRGFQREVSFYEAFGADAGIPVPCCYASGYNADDNSCMLLMDYIDNTRERNVETATIEDIEMAVEHLAIFHAKWWGKVREIKNVCSEHAPFLLDRRVREVTIALEKIHNRYSDDVGRTAISLLEFWLSNVRLLTEYLEKGPLTLCHSDFHPQQILFPIAEDDPFCVIDWQFVSSDCGPADLSRIIHTGLLPELRKENERELVEKYYALICRYGVTGYSLEKLWTHYLLGILKIIVLNARVFTVQDIPLALQWWEANGPKEISLWELLFRWPGQAIEEHGGVSVISRIVQKGDIRK